MAIDLDEAERRGTSASPGPWNWCDSGDLHDANDNPVIQVIEDDEVFVASQVRDKLFIAYARNNWQSMIDELKAWRGMHPQCHFDGQHIV